MILPFFVEDIEHHQRQQPVREALAALVGHRIERQPLLVECRAPRGNSKFLWLLMRDALRRAA